MNARLIPFTAVGPSFLPTITGLADGKSDVSGEWMRLGELFYLIAILSFAVWHFLVHFTGRVRDRDTFLVRFLSVFPDVVLLYFLLLYEFSARPAIRNRFRMLGYHELPSPTHLLLDVIPAGALSSVLAFLIILCLWLAHTKGEPRLISGTRSALFVYGPLLLLAIPIVLTMPVLRAPVRQCRFNSRLALETSVGKGGQLGARRRTDHHSARFLFVNRSPDAFGGRRQDADRFPDGVLDG